MAPGYGIPLKCDCCGTVTLAMQYPDRIVIKAIRHGVQHTLVIPFQVDARALTISR